MTLGKVQVNWRRLCQDPGFLGPLHGQARSDKVEDGSGSVSSWHAGPGDGVSVRIQGGCSELAQTSLLPKSPYMGMFSTWLECLFEQFEAEKCDS